MKFVRPPSATAGQSASLTGRSPTHYPPAKPQWLKDYIADLGRWALLDCGHKENLNSRSVLIIAVIGKRHVRVLCERCNDWTFVVRYMQIREYMGIPPIVNSDEPLF